MYQRECGFSTPLQLLGDRERAVLHEPGQKISDGALGIVRDGETHDASFVSK